MPSKKGITKVRFNDASRTANQLSAHQKTTRPASKRSNSPSNARAASSPQLTTPRSPTLSLNVSTPLRLAHKLQHSITS